MQHDKIAVMAFSLLDASVATNIRYNFQVRANPKMNQRINNKVVRITLTYFLFNEFTVT